MNKKINIFDLTNLDDLPEDCRTQLGVPLFKTNKTKKTFELFSLKNKLTVDEIIVALYRKHKIKIKRQEVQSILFNWKVKYNFLKKINKNQYEFISRPEERVCQ